MTIITITNMDTREFFFSTEHCQPLPDNFVPVSWYGKNHEQVREVHLEMGEVEIINPDDNFVPDFIIGEM
jgi:hypothetical protein